MLSGKAWLHWLSYEYSPLPRIEALTQRLAAPLARARLARLCGVITSDCRLHGDEMERSLTRTGTRKSSRAREHAQLVGRTQRVSRDSLELSR